MGWMRCFPLLLPLSLSSLSPLPTPSPARSCSSQETNSSDERKFHLTTFSLSCLQRKIFFPSFFINENQKNKRGGGRRRKEGRKQERKKKEGIIEQERSKQKKKQRKRKRNAVVKMSLAGETCCLLFPYCAGFWKEFLAQNRV